MQNLIETWQPVRVLKLFTDSVFQVVYRNPYCRLVHQFAFQMKQTCAMSRKSQTVAIPVRVRVLTSNFA
jgi:hypothetical protein